MRAKELEKSEKALAEKALNMAARIVAKGEEIFRAKDEEAKKNQKLYGAQMTEQVQKTAAACKCAGGTENASLFKTRSPPATN